MLTRIKLNIATNGSIIAVGCIVVGLLLLMSAGYVYATPGVDEQPPEEVDSFNIEITLKDSARTMNETPLYGEGERIESKSVYFLNSTPEMTFDGVVETVDDRNVEVTQELVLFEYAERNGEMFWSREKTLADEKTNVTGGKSEINARMNVENFTRDQQDIINEMDGVSEPNSEVQLRTTYETETVAGESYNGTLSVSRTMNIVPNAYWFEGSQTENDIEQQFIDQPPNPNSPNMSVVFVFVLLGFGFLGLSKLVLQQSKQYNAQDLRVQMHNEEYRDWISKGEISIRSEHQYVSVKSLKDLVDIAVDSNNRVIHDDLCGMYAVIDNGLIYYYTRGYVDIESRLDIEDSQS